MKKKSTPQLGIAALSVSLAAHQSGGDIQLTPDGTFKARDGRPEGLPGFHIDADVAEMLLTRLRTRTNDIVVDYEHQTLNSEENGQPAPAAGWIDPQSIRYVPGKGLIAQVTWTTKAASHIANDEYRYLSPVLAYDKNSGAVRDILHVALTNFAAVDGMAKVAIAALRTRFEHEHDPFPSNPETETGDSLVDKSELIQLLGLSPDATDEQITTALKAAQSATVELAALRAAVGVADGQADTEAVAALKANAKPDPAKYAPVEVVEALKGEIATLKSGQEQSEVAALVQQGLDAGKLLPAQKDWATDLGNNNVAALKSYLSKTPGIAALKSTQTGGHKPAGADQQKPHADADAVAVLKQLGVTAEDAAKASEQETN